MARKDRLLPPVARNITDYDAQYMEQYHKRMYKSFLAMRQHIGTEYKARATRETIDGRIYYTYYNLKNNIAKGTPGFECMRWHGASEEKIQEIVNYNNSNDLEYLRLNWRYRRKYDQTFFNDIQPIIDLLEARTYDVETTTDFYASTYFNLWVIQATTTTPITELNLSPQTPFSTVESAVWNIIFGFNLVDITDNGTTATISVNETRKQDVINNQNQATTLVFWNSLQNLTSLGNYADYNRIKEGVSRLGSIDGNMFYTPPILYDLNSAIVMQIQQTYLDKIKFENSSQDDFFDIYSEHLLIDSKLDTTWWEDFVAGLLKFIGNFINFVLDVLLSIPLIGEIIEWVIEGIAGLFNMTFAEARALLIQALVAVIALNLTAVGGFSYFAYIEWLSSAWSIGGIAGELASATYEDPFKQIEEQEEEEFKRQLENIQGELNLIVGIQEPIIRLNRPEEELQVNGDNNSTYTIFRLD